MTLVTRALVFSDFPGRSGEHNPFPPPRTKLRDTTTTVKMLAEPYRAVVSTAKRDFLSNHP